MDLIIPEALKGRINPIVTCVIEGILDEEDLRALALGAPPSVPGAPPPEVDDPADLKKVREKHHSVARLIASGGMSQRMVATITGYTEGYLSVLLNNPAMIELVEMYRIQSGAANAIITEKLKTVGGKALEKLEGKIDAGDLNANELIQAAKLGMDRAGHGPTSSSRHVEEKHLVDHAELTRLHNEARRGSAEYTVPVEQVRKALTDARPAPETSDEG
jgi:hypothetical protein